MKIGILGTGIIAKAMAEAVCKMDYATNYAIASRNIKNAEEFKEKYNFEKAYGSYEELVKDENVELVYIATPHSHHYENAMLSLKNNKPILCEKAFMANSKQAKEVLTYSKEHNIFVTEAIWTRYIPSCKKIKELINSGIIGEVGTFSSNFGNCLNKIKRLNSPELAGGALLDVGVYPIQFANTYFGNDIEKMVSTHKKNENGVDLQNTIVLQYKNGIVGMLHSGIDVAKDKMDIIHGTKGYIISKRENDMVKIEVFKSGEETIVYELPGQSQKFDYQIKACIKAMQEGKIECEEIPHKDILSVMELMDSLRNEWGIKYPFE